MPLIRHYEVVLMVGTVRDFLEKDLRLERIVIVCFSQDDYQTYLRVYKDMQL